MEFVLWPHHSTPEDLHEFRHNYVFQEAIMSKEGVYVEQRPDGEFAVRKEGSKRASAVKPTQAEAIARAKELAPGGEIHVERVRNVGDGRDKFREA